jgi:protein-S-isoprenylcysteine O-methyltransferase Ste14
MNRIIIFLILSIPIIVISWRTIFNIRSHGFFRFFSWECIIWLFAANYKYWFEYPFSLNQIFSWIFLIISAYLIIVGVILMKKVGKQGTNRNEKTLYQFEKTTELIEQGIFKYIRHPLYSSLLFLTWGIFLKNFSIELLFVSMLSTVFLYLTAIFDEKECIDFFGDKYIEYMKKSKRFIPYII